MAIQPQVAEILYTKNAFGKKLLEDAGGMEETSRLLRYCCWENNHFSWNVLSDILWQVGFLFANWVGLLCVVLIVLVFVCLFVCFAGRFRLYLRTSTAFGLALVHIDSRGFLAEASHHGRF